MKKLFFAAYVTVLSGLAPALFAGYLCGTAQKDTAGQEQKKEAAVAQAPAAAAVKNL